MVKHRNLSQALWLCAALTTAVQAAPSALTSMDMWRAARPAGLTVSPDGQRAVFSLSQYDAKADASQTDLYLLDLQSGQTRQLTSHKAPDTAPAWSPEGRRISYVSKRDGELAQLQLLSLDGAEPITLTDLPVAVSNPRWLPDGKRVLFVAEVPKGFAGDFAALKDKLAAEKKRGYSAKVTENRLYRYWDHWLTDETVPQFFSVDVQSKEIQALTPGWSQLMNLEGSPDFDVSPDGKWLSVSALASKPPYNDENFDVYLLPLDGSGKAKNITAANLSDDNKPVFSPDGRALVYGARQRVDFGADNVRLTRFDLQKQSATVLTSNIDLSAEQWLFSRDGATLYFLAQDKAKTSLFSVPALGGAVKQVLRQGSNEQLQVAGPQKLVLVQHSLSKLPEIYFLDNQNRTLKQISQLNSALQQNTAWGQVEDVSFAGADGQAVQMFIVYPPNFDKNQRWPLLSVLHGGPHSASLDAFSMRWNAQVFAAMGYVVIMPNFHGSTGFGETYTASIHGDHPTKPFFDTEAAVDYMVSRGYIDESRIAAAGGSYGGYLVSWIAGHSSKYKALINHAGVYDLMAQFASDSTTMRVHAYNGSPWQNKDNVLKASPAMYADKFKTPMLITHGEKDYRVPVTQGLAQYGVLKGKGIDARLVYFPDENHWILKPQNSMFWYNEVQQWLERYLGKGPTQ